MKRKVIHIISNLSIGGAQLLLFDIINNLKKEELEIEVITIDSGFYIDKFKKAGIKVRDLKCKGLVNPLIFLKLRNILKEIKPDIVHTHLLKADFYGRIAAKWLKIPVVFTTCHNDSTTHKLNKTNKKNIFDRIDNWVIDYTNSNIIAISERVKQFLLNRKNNKLSEKISVIYNGIEIEKEDFILNNEEIKYFRSTLKLEKEDFVISIIGRLEEQKGHLEFLGKCSEIIKELNLKILIVGEGSQRNKIENLIKNEKLENNVYLLGFKDDTEKYYEISDLIVIPSIWEGFGIVACEGMIKGKVVLASNVGGLSEIIDDGIDGFLYNDKNLIQKLEYIYRNQNNLGYISDNSKVKVKMKFDIQKNSKKYYQCYEEKINSHEL